MNLQQRKAELEAELAKINEELSGKPTPEQRFREIVSSINQPFVSLADWPGYIFFFRNGEFIMYYNPKTGYLGCSDKHLWSVFEEEHDMKYDDIEAMIKVQVEEAFKAKGITPLAIMPAPWVKVEEAFKAKGI